MNKICLIGSNGFIAKNFLTQSYLNKFEIIKIHKKNIKKRIKSIKNTNILLHFAGTNRSKNKKDFEDSNINLINQIINNINKKKTPIIIYLSTNKINEKSIYGKSKKEGERLLVKFCKKNKISLYIYRLPNVFGKWSKPFYNSVISTFCYSIMNNLKYKNNAPNKLIKIAYVGDIINSINKKINKKKHQQKISFMEDFKIYPISLKDLESRIISFKNFRSKKNIDIFKSTLSRKLYSTYVSYFDKNNFFHKIENNEDSRGRFSEFIKSKNFGQISALSIKPNRIRGCHYHHYKTEKFLIIGGSFKVTYFDISNKNKKFIKKFNNKKSYVIETIPGYYHEIKNIGKHEICILIWSNEIYDPLKPDTYILNEKI